MARGILQAGAEGHARHAPGHTRKGELTMGGLTVITGPPCSGKTTYLRQHARPGDITIDFDDLAQVLGSPVSHGHAISHRSIAMAVLRTAVTEAIAWVQRGSRAWIADGTPRTRLAQYSAARAEFAVLTAPPGELHRRAAAERPAAWHALIDKWLADHSGPAWEWLARNTVS